MKIVNKKAYFNFEVMHEFDAGIMLVGSEVKSIHKGGINFGDSFLYFNNGEIFLKNLRIDTYKDASHFNHEETRDRKILLHKNEIRRISKEIQVRGVSIVPLAIFQENGKIKVKIGVCRGKKSFNKKELLKEKDIKRDIERNY